MAQPKNPYVKLPGQSQFQMQTPLINVTLNPEAFEQFINSQGVRMIHSRPVPCPAVRDVYSPDHHPSCNVCYNGFVYYNEKEFIGGFMGNNLDRQYNVNGSWDLDQATIVVPVKNLDGDILDVQFFDQILMPDVSVRYYQRVEHSQSGIDRLQFPALSLDFVIDNRGTIYRPGVDVVVEQGRLKWIGNRPGFNASLQRGEIYSVNYYTRPAFTVIGLPHQIRTAQTKDLSGGNNIPARFPQLCIVRKDFIPYDRTDHIGAPDRPEPKDGSF